MKSNKPTITIIGAGVAGTFLALQFARRGYIVEVFERLTEKETLTNSSNRSFNLTFYRSALQELKKLGLWNVIKSKVVILEGSSTQVTPESKETFIRFEDHTPYYTTERESLLSALIDSAKQDPLITFHFGKSLVSVDRYRKILLLENIRSGKIIEQSCDVVFGADGVNSLVRSFMQQGQESQHKLEYEDWEYKQISLPEKFAKQVGMKNNRQYTWTRKETVLIAFPSGTGSFNALLIVPKGSKSGFSILNTSTKIRAFILRYYPTLLPALQPITSSVLSNPVGNFVTVYTKPWYYKNFLAVVGDAAHGFLPFYGLGMSVAFEDCMEIVKLVDRYGTNWQKIFSHYQTNRKVHTDVIADLCKESFEGFRRSKKADYKSVYDAFEQAAHRIFPMFYDPPIFFSVAVDPGHAANYFARFVNQRKRAKFMGVPVAVGLVTGVIGILENSQQIYKRMARKQK